MISTAYLSFSLKKLIAMKHGHTKLVVCPHVWHKWDTDADWIPVLHMFDTRSYVSNLKNIIFRLGHASDTIEYGSARGRAQLGYMSDMTEHGSDTARTQSNTFFFPIIWWTKKEFKGSKIQLHLRSLFEMSTEILSHIFWKWYREYT